MSRDRTTVSRLLTLSVGVGMVVLGWITPVVAGQAADVAWVDDLSPIAVAYWDHDKSAHPTTWPGLPP